MLSMKEKVLNDLETMGVEIIYCTLKKNKAIAFGDKYIGFDDTELTDAEAATILCHDSGHYICGAFYYNDSPFAVRDKAERRATTASIRRYVPYEKLLECLRQEMPTWEIAEHFGLTEEIIHKAFYYYKETRGFSFGE